MGWNCPRCKSDLILTQVEADSSQMELIFDPHTTHTEHRAQALYTAWKNSRKWTSKLGITMDIDELMNSPGWRYNGGAYLVFSATIGKFDVLAGNAEIQTDTLEEAEKWLWNNHERFERGADEV